MFKSSVTAPCGVLTHTQAAPGGTYRAWGFSGIAEVLLRKLRYGPIGDRRLRFVDRFARFEDLE